MRILFIGDIVGKPGRQAVRDLLPGIRERYRSEFVVANGENAAGGFGLTPPVAEELFGYGIDVLTSGNHIWDRSDVLPLLDGDPRVVRPANYPPGVPGLGATVISTRGVRIGVINVAGRVFSPSHLDCPFRTVDRELDALVGRADIFVVDFHAEATSEKVAFGWYLDGRVSAVIGTHTHVQTADFRVLPNGTAYITDVGMTGPIDSVIGIKTDIILERFLYQLPVRFEVAGGIRCLSGVVVDIDGEGKAARIEPVSALSDPGACPNN